VCIHVDEACSDIHGESEMVHSYRVTQGDSPKPERGDSLVVFVSCPKCAVAIACVSIAIMRTFDVL
jgi:hypothetical protein